MNHAKGLAPGHSLSIGHQTSSSYGLQTQQKPQRFCGKCDYGHCVSRNLKYFGFKLVTVSTFNGILMLYELMPANTDERKAVEAVIEYFSFCDFFADKGFLGLKWQTQIFDQTNNLIWTPRRSNQRNQNSKKLGSLVEQHSRKDRGRFSRCAKHWTQYRTIIDQNRVGVMHSSDYENDQSPLATFVAYRF